MSGKRPPRSNRPKPAQRAPSSNESLNPTAGLGDVGFVVDLFLDESRQVRLTQALHVRSGEGDAWEGWDEDRLINFFVQRAELALVEKPVAAEAQAEKSAPEHSSEKVSADSKTEAVVEGAVSADVLPGVSRETPAVVGPVEDSAPNATQPPATAQAEQTLAEDALTISTPDSGRPSSVSPPTSISEKNRERLASMMGSAAGESADVALHGMQVITANAPTPSRLLRSGEPFDVSLSLGFADWLKRSEGSFDYTASVLARRCEDNSRRFLGQDEGSIGAGDETIVVSIPKQELPPGVYRLEAYLEARPPMMNAGVVRKASVTSGVLQVY
ncbi:MAG: hypothetical protein ACREBD_17360 [Blastocatellia bacterium]